LEVGKFAEITFAEIRVKILLFLTGKIAEKKRKNMKDFSKSGMVFSAIRKA